MDYVIVECSPISRIEQARRLIYGMYPDSDQPRRNIETKLEMLLRLSSKSRL